MSHKKSFEGHRYLFFYLKSRSLQVIFWLEQPTKVYKTSTLQGLHIKINELLLFLVSSQTVLD